MNARRRRRGVTLLEVMLSMSLLVLLSSLTYWFYSSSMATRERETSAADRLRLIRVVLDRLAVEIRQATTMTKDGGVGIVGEKERIRLSALRLPDKNLAAPVIVRDTPPDAQYDMVKVEYKIARHPDILHADGYELPLGLARVETRIPRRLPTIPPAAAGDGATQSGAGTEDTPLDEASLDELFGGDQTDQRERASLDAEVDWEELYAPEIRYLRFCYFDGQKWWDDWQVKGENPLPQLVMVTVGFESHPPCGEEFGQDEINVKFCECLNRQPSDCEPLAADQFSTVVRVTHADPLFRSRVTREGQNLVETVVQDGTAGTGSKGGAGKSGKEGGQ